jgi:hypothetical protein
MSKLINAWKVANTVLPKSFNQLYTGGLHRLDLHSDHCIPTIWYVGKWMNIRNNIETDHYKWGKCAITGYPFIKINHHNDTFNLKIMSESEYINTTKYQDVIITTIDRTSFRQKMARYHYELRAAKTAEEKNKALERIKPLILMLTYR